MRWLFSCSAILLLAACGGRSATTDPFAYDRAAPLAPSRATVFARSPWGTIRAFTFAGVDGTRVPAYIVVPRTRTRKPGVLLLHGSGGTRYDLIGEAALVAERGAVALTISYPSDAPTFRPLVVDARRALDLLAARDDVDPSRLGVVGFSLGAQLAAILAGDDPRVKAADVIAGRGTDVTLYWIRRAKRARLFFQAGTHDQVVPHEQLLALMDAAPGKPQIAWYSAGHELTPAIDRGLTGWVIHTLG